MKENTLAKIKRPGSPPIERLVEPRLVTPPRMTEQESLASRIAYERCKPELDAALAKLNARLSRPILPLAKDTETRRHLPNTYYRCAEHGQPLDPWGLCHHGCKRCERETPFERIWTHKGACAPARAPLVRGT